MNIDLIKNKYNLHYFWIILFAFATVYAFSLTFYYAEGDDAATALYHVMGRLPQLQKPYEPYHSGFDFILSFLPANELIIRYTMIGISALAQIILMIGIFKLVFSWLQIKSKSLLASLIVFIVLLSIPELFFMGLYYNPTNVSLAFLVFSHIILKKSFEYNNKWNYLYFLSIFLFAFGASIRWNMAIYGLVIFMEPLLLEKINKNKFIKYFVWSFLALSLFFVSLWLEGIRMADIDHILHFKETNLDVLVRSLSERIRQNISFFTPATLLLLAIGFIGSLKSNYKFVIYALIGFTLNYLYFDSLFFKILAPFYVFIIYFMVKGIAVLYDYKKIKWKVSVSVITIIAIIPWIIGVQLQNSRTWGPGFQVKQKYYNLEVEKRSKKKKYSWKIVLFGDGTGFAHPEGPRPIYGYASVLLGGKWRAMILEDQKEYYKMYYTAKQKGYPFLKIGFNNNIENILYSQGYTTNQKEKEEIFPNLHRRVFYNNIHDSIEIFHIEKRAYLNDSLINTIISYEPYDTVVPYGEYYGEPFGLKTIF